jgi:hypothetical protein
MTFLRAVLLKIFLLGLLGSPGSNAVADPIKGRVVETGLELNAGAMGTLTLNWPNLHHTEGPFTRPAVIQSDSTLAVLSYGEHGVLELNWDNDTGFLSVGFEGMARTARHLRFEMRIPIQFNRGGEFAFDGAALRPFPAEHDQQFVEHGSFQSLSLRGPHGGSLRLQTPGGYQGIQDNRAFNWQTFLYIYHFDFSGRREGFFQFKITEAEQTGAPRAESSFVIDRFGQFAAVDFPGKITSEEELLAYHENLARRAAIPADAPLLDRFGGLAGSGEELGLEATGFFRTDRVGNRHIIVSPEGNLFFQLGVCGIANTDDFTLVRGREAIYEWLPPREGKWLGAWRDSRPASGIASFYLANWIRINDRPFDYNLWTEQVIDRLLSWGFNSTGAFSVRSQAMIDRDFPFIARLNLNPGGAIRNLPDRLGAGYVMDPFVPGVAEALSARFATEVAPLANDPAILGFFMGNEQHFEMLPRLLPTYRGSQVAAKQRLVEFLAERHETVEAFKAAWGITQELSSFPDLLDLPLFVNTPTAASDMAAFFELFMDTYYRVIAKAFREHAPHHLLLGSRWTMGTSNNQTVVQAAGRYLDVLSINYYTYGLSEEFLARVHEWGSEKPIILSEWYFSSTERGLGAMRQVENQEARGLAYRSYVEQAASIPFVVGSQWFIYTDQAPTGRFFEGFHGEAYNTGLVDVTDRPYTELVTAAQKTHHRIYDVMMGKTTAFIWNDSRFADTRKTARKQVTIPRTPGTIEIDGTTRNWPGRPAESIPSQRVALGQVNHNFQADFRLAWDDTALYVHVAVKDPTPKLNRRPSNAIWGADSVELFLGFENPEKPGSLLFNDRQILIRAHPQAEVHFVNQPSLPKTIQAVAIKDVDGSGYSIEAAIPWKILEFDPRSGQNFLFDIAVNNSDDGLTRQQQIVWNGSAGNSGDRGLWGRAVLSQN